VFVQWRTLRSQHDCDIVQRRRHSLLPNSKRDGGKSIDSTRDETNGGCSREGMELRNDDQLNVVILAFSTIVSC
jgi:hypothetical protein